MKERTVLRIEDLLLIAGILPLWLPVVGYRGLWVWGLLFLDAALMGFITVRRIRRLSRLREGGEGPPPPPFPPGGWKK